MSNYILIDRRKNPKDKSLSNRQRFFKRAKKAVREAAKKALGGRNMSDTGDAVINIPTEGIQEPHFRHDHKVGEHDIVLPGNTEYIEGDLIWKDEPPQGGSSGGGPGDSGQDDFEFALTHDEFLDVIFDDLELPDLIKKTEKNAVAWSVRRAGYTNSGSPTNLNVEKTVVAGIARRMALKRPKLRRIEELEAEEAALIETIQHEESIGEATAHLVDRLKEIEDEITTLKARAAAINFLDNVDMRYNNFIKVPRPITQAVMFCIMDVSFSMGEREKIIAKKFFILMNLFLKRRYENIDVVFIRHHTEAIECDEETFFTSREGGGTVVSSGYKKMLEVVRQRYNLDDWNVYVAQASDGDNWDFDNQIVSKLLSEEILPFIQHFTYIEITDEWRKAMATINDLPFYNSNLWNTIQTTASSFENVSCAQIDDEREVITVFRNLFKQEQSQ